jgi:hypothetical protein
MNCANHPERAPAAYCRTCGKPVCQECARNVRGVIYCENCLAARLEGVQPQQTVHQQVMDQGLGLKVPPSPGPGPSPGLAGVLAGFFPFGVGAVYCGQYSKGLAHLAIFAILIMGLSSGGSASLNVGMALALSFFYVYQIVDAVRSAKALQSGQPAPDPFNLSKTFSTGERIDASKIPTGAIVLIVLGVLFMLHNLGMWFLGIGRLWPLILIGLGAWLFAKRWGLIGPHGAVCNCDRCRAAGLMGPAVLVTLGVLFLLEQQDMLSFGRTWPILLVMIGLVKVFQANASTSGHVEQSPPELGLPRAAPPPPSEPPSPSANVPPPSAPMPPSSGEVQNG